ncbi:TauD/TfdA dioxygenase family protein [Sphingorhabdus sp.]|jgi:taurine dioxygenase|uniref:TauD/TfdA dioxygenase family protein n=1 Tax=Sphingorhabdus sp. TaxID=1902408 RepID=UPI003BB07636|nr:TauD/TfdA family dioxygenase [Sphingomonadales bacterium]MBK9433304.1 TauD/TfdA family dioxygenase [Sphingomonadales bacterium]MBL0022621.1 TauD/TfdA family dioxygenase [Sphingomonadales bacterium]
MQFEKLTCNIGAELKDVQIRDAIDSDDLFSEIHRHLLENKVIFFRDQELTPAQHVAFASRFGALEDHPVAGSDPDNPGLVNIFKDETATPLYYENNWHADVTWRENPQKMAVLRCVQCPEVGGDTMWSNMTKAYEDLPQHIKQQIDGLYARHSIEASFGAAMPIEKRHALKAQFPDAEHPVVVTHPETGEEVLYVSAYTTHFTNFHTPDNVRYGNDFTPGHHSLLLDLVRRAAIPEYQVRWRWTPNSVAIWDNTLTQHYAVADYPPSVRQMQRAGVIGQRPVR